ncbi:unnamed protein product [Paramecium octaurelia]|uniref:EML-like second beta-propeller domain-containing protein n=1 Tax=Paramecium octaurelia TaxID=43137 RepID=A0A8S1WYA5_PAROT|nr:unnamed protein product [Paramecium octaurelia]
MIQFLNLLMAGHQHKTFFKELKTIICTKLNQDCHKARILKDFLKSYNYFIEGNHICSGIIFFDMFLIICFVFYITNQNMQKFEQNDKFNYLHIFQIFLFSLKNERHFLIKRIKFKIKQQKFNIIFKKHMNCIQHNQYQVSMICTAPHYCKCQRKMCVECQYKHGVDLKYTVPINIFQEMFMKKLKECNLDETSEITKQKDNFKLIISQTERMMKTEWEQLSESIKLTYDLIEEKNKSYSYLINQINNLAESSYSDIEELVQILEGKNMDDWGDEKNVYLIKLQKYKNQLEQEVMSFVEKLKREIMIPIQKITQDLTQVYQRKENLYEILVQTKQFNEQFLDEIIEMLQKEKIRDCIEYLSNKGNKQQPEFKIMIGLLKNIFEIDFNRKNYSTEVYEQIRKDLIKQVSYDKQIIRLLKFLVKLTAIDERYIQCGSNSFNLLIEMKVDLREQTFENIRIRDAILVGGNFERCNFNGSEFDNVDISGINLNEAQLYNCKWKNIKIHELNKLDGHSHYVMSVCFSPDGTTLASGSYDKSIRLWDVKTGQQKAKLDGHSSCVNSIHFSSDCSTLASGGYDQSIRLWDIKKGKEKAKIVGHSSTVYAVCFSPDGTVLAFGSGDQSIRQLDIKMGQQKAILDGHSSTVYTVCFSPDGTTLASGSGDQSIRLWDFKTKQQLAILEGHSVCFSPDGAALASGSDDSSICLWDVKTGQQKAKLNGHSSCIKSISFFPDGKILASGSHDKFIRLWDVKTGQQKAILEGHSSFVNSICFSFDGTTLASGSFDKSIRLWDVKTGLQIAMLDGHCSFVNRICFSPDGTMLACVRNDNSICLWDVTTGQQKAKLDGHSNCIRQIFFSPDGTTLASSSSNNSICFWDVKTGQQKAKLFGHSNFFNPICFSPDSSTLASVRNDNSIRLWDVTTGEQIAQLDGQPSTVTSVCFSSDGTTLASTGSNHSINLWDVKGEKLKVKLYGHTSKVQKVCFSSDGTTLASCSDDNTICLWDVKTGQQKAKLDSHSNSVQLVSFSFDDTALASFNRDKSIHLWDVKAKKEILPQDYCYKDLLPQFKILLQNSSILQKAENVSTIIRICQNPTLEAKGAQILMGEFVNYLGIDMRYLFQSKGSYFLETCLQSKNN